VPRDPGKSGLYNREKKEVRKEIKFSDVRVQSIETPPDGTCKIGEESDIRSRGGRNFRDGDPQRQEEGLVIGSWVK